jgi:hypothetical protein
MGFKGAISATFVTVGGGKVGAAVYVCMNL